LNLGVMPGRDSATALAPAFSCPRRASTEDFAAMDDVARLGLTVDSSQVLAGTKALTGLTAAAQQTTPAVAALAAAAASTNAPMAAAATNTKALGTAAVAGAAAVTAHGAASTKTASAHAGLSTQAMAAMHSIRSMSESIAMGMPMTTVLGQQMSHLSYAASGPGGIVGAFSEVGTTLLGSIPTWAYVTAGVVGVGAAIVLTAANIVKTEVAFGDLSERTQTTIQDLHALQAVAAFKGIDSSDFFKGMQQFGTLTSEARYNMGSLAELFHANGVAAGSLNQNLANAADLISNAASEAEKYRLIQQLGLPASRQWVQYLSQGGDGLRQATANAAQFGGVANDAMVAKAREFDEAWNRGWKNFKTSAKTAFVTVGGFFGGLIGQWQEFTAKFVSSADLFKATFAGGGGTTITANSNINDYYDKMKSATGGDSGAAGKPTVDPVVLKAQIGLSQQYIGILGALATVQDQVKEKENSITLARLAGVNVTAAEEKAILSYSRAQAIGLLTIHQQADAQRIDAETLTLGVGASAAYRAEAERILALRLQGITLIPKDAAALHEQARALGEAAQATAQLRVQMDLAFARSQLGRTDIEAQIAAQAKQLHGDDYASHLNDSIAQQARLNDALAQTKAIGTDAFSGILQGMRDGNTGAQNLQATLTKLENKLFDIASNAAWSAIIRGVGSLGGAPSATPGYNPNSLSQIYHSGGMGNEPSGTRMVDPSIFASAPRYHTGNIPGVQSHEIAAVIRKDEAVLTPGQMKALGNRGGGNNVQVNVVNNAPGTQATASKRSAGGVDIHDIIISTVNDGMANGKFDGAQRARFGNQIPPRGR
jgi:hypothetical protein